MIFHQGNPTTAAIIESVLTLVQLHGSTLFGAPLFPGSGKGGCFDLSVAVDVLSTLAFVCVDSPLHPGRRHEADISRANRTGHIVC
jgi:hypothetical protein